VTQDTGEETGTICDQDARGHTNWPFVKLVALLHQEMKL